MGVRDPARSSRAAHQPCFVSHTVAQVAESIRARSFAILACDRSLADALWTARRTAQEYFDSILVLGNDDEAGGSSTGKTALSASGTPLHRVIDNGCLLGFNVPSPAKCVFRAYPHHPRQPWPGDDHPRLRDDSSEVAARLHRLLHECWVALRLQLLSPRRRPDEEAPPESGAEDDLAENEAVQPSSAKRSKISPISEERLIGAIPPRGCPLDYFYYHNRGPPDAPNCTEHVDRGLLIAVCLTAVPGLEVRWRAFPTAEATDDRYLCPEELLLESGPREATYVAVLAGDALKDHLPAGSPKIPACVHRVRTPLAGPRLSVSYELRPP